MEQYIPLVTKNCVRKILPGEIIYIMKKQRKLHIATDRETYAVYERLEVAERILDRRFYACLRNFYINLDKVERMENQTVFFCNGDSIPLGRDSYVRTKQHYSAYLKKLL